MNKSDSKTHNSPPFGSVIPQTAPPLSLPLFSGCAKMSSGRVTIPSGAHKTIQNIREIAGNHSDEEIYAMLQECSMDPNETAQKLLLQDTFHEVKRKRDRRKEHSREAADSRWRSGSQGRVGKGGRGNYSSRYASHDVSGGRNFSIGKENGVDQGTDKGITSISAPVVLDTENKSMVTISSPAAGLANDLTRVEHPTAQECTSQVPGISGSASVEENYHDLGNKMGIPPPGDVKISSRQSAPDAEQFLSAVAQSSVSGVYASASDPVPVPSLDAHNPDLVGAIKREKGCQQSAVEATINKVISHDATGSELSSISGKDSSEMSHVYTHGKMQSKGNEANKLQDTSQSVSTSSLSGSMASRPSSNYSNRSQQQIGPQRVGPIKEWKPKSTNVNPAQASGTNVNPCDVEGEAVARSQPASSSTTSEDSSVKLQKKLQELQFSEAQHVIIPNHLQVPESARSGLIFGSFDANFVPTTRYANDPDSDKSSTHLSELSQEIGENAEEPSSSNQSGSPAAQETEYPEPHSPEPMPETLSSQEPDLSNISAVPEYDQSKPAAALPPEGLQYSVVHTAPTYTNFGIVPQMLGSQFATFEGAEPQSRDASRLPSFVVQQPFDPSPSFYTQIYRPAADGDGRFSPFLAPAAATTKYNGNVAVLPAHTGQSPQESGNSLVLSSTGPTLVTQAAGGMQSSVAVSQPPVPVFRQPAGVHISHFPSNYFPYSQYVPPFYVPSPAIHHFLSNTAYPQQPPTGNIYPPPAAAAGAAPVKYSLSQYKPVSNTSNPIALPTGYGSYGSSPAYSPSMTSGNSTGSEDLASSQYKENNMYITGQQQSEGSAVWIPATGRDISALQASSFYNLPQGQHMTFAPSQAGQGAFTGLYHPTQTVAAGGIHPLLQQSQAMPGAIEMVNPSGVYQQPQRAQVNWVNNY